MRAWLLLLAVLATFQTIVQVASTEDNISSRFITAIQPIKKDFITPHHKTSATTAVVQKSPSSTVLTKLVNYPIAQGEDKTIVYNKHKSDSDKLITSEQVQKNKNNINIEIKNIEKIDLENEIIKESESELVKQQKQKNIKNKTKMSLKESKIEQQQNQKNKQHQLKEDSTTNESSSHHQKHNQHQQHHHHHPHHKQQQHKSQPASQHQHQTTSDNLTSTSSSSTALLPSSLNEDFPSPPSSLDLYVLRENGVISVEPQQPQTDADTADDGPQTFSNKEILKEKTKLDPSTRAQIQNGLLSMWKLERPPKIDRSKIYIPDELKEMYKQSMGHEWNSGHIPKPGLLTKSANTIRSFTHKDSKIDDRFPHHHRFRLYFDIKSIPAEEKLKAAELLLARDAISHASLSPRLAKKTRYQVLVYDITQVGIKGKIEPSYLLLDNKMVRLDSTDKVSLDVQPAVDRWLASPKENFGLLIEVRTSRSLNPAPHHHVRLRRSAGEEHEHWQRKQPLLYTYTDDAKQKSGNGKPRRKNRHKNNEENCRRHPMYVDFADVGWSDWIVAPPGYDAFYCAGNCPFPLADHLNSTNHAVVQTLVNNLYPGKVPKACCVATELEGISMLYLNDQNTVVLKNYQDMSVVGCGCR